MHDHLNLPPEALLDHIRPGTRILVPIAAGEPARLLDVLEAHAGELEDVHVYQMCTESLRPYQLGAYPGKLTHHEFFLGGGSREGHRNGTTELYPVSFSMLPEMVREQIRPDILITSVSEPDSHGYMSMGLSADYSAQFIGEIPVFAEINPNVPHTYGANQIHPRQLAGATLSDVPLKEVPPLLPEPGSPEMAIAELIAPEIGDRDCLQLGIGKLPNAILSMLGDRRDLGVHTELMSDGVMDLVECGAVTGRHKKSNRGKSVATFAMGTRRLYDWLDHNPAVYLDGVDVTNDPYLIGAEPNMVSVNATVEVDLLGQAASETIGGRFYSGSGGQLDFAIGARRSPGGRGYIVTPSVTRGGVSRITVALPANSPVTTQKNYIDNVVTEYGIARLRGTSYSERARRLIEIAHPDHREDLYRGAREMNIISRLVTV